LIKTAWRGTGRVKALVTLVAAALASTVLIPSSSLASPLLEAEELVFCTLINDYRAAHGLPALLISTDLSEAADWHTDDMAAKNYFGHTDSLGRDAFTRMAAFGYTYSTWKGENIAAGNWTASGTFTQWKNSLTHNTSMLNPNFKVIGIARSYSSTSTYKYYWNNSFGGFVDAGAAPCGTSPSPSPSPSPTATPPSITVSDALVSEGSWFTNYARFTVRLSKTSTSAVTVSYATANGTALAGSDYLARSGTRTIYAGQTTTTINVPIVRDLVREGNETFILNLFSPGGATIGDGQGIATITNDD
jgi:uncharacterized protein YkwD